MDNASPIALLVFRFAIALAMLLLVGVFRGKWLPEKGTRWQVVLTGLMLIGGYAVCYFQAMGQGVTPGLIATIMGIQPILTLCIVERRMKGTRLSGLIIALAGLVLLVWRSLSASYLPLSGILFALAALLFMTFGAIMQKKIHQSPAEVLPLQYGISLLLCLLLIPLGNALPWSGAVGMAAILLGIMMVFRPQKPVTA